MRISPLYNALPIYLTSPCSTGRVHIPCSRRVVAYVRLGVMRLGRNICGEVKRGMVCNSRGDVTLTRVGRVEGLIQTRRQRQ